MSTENAAPEPWGPHWPDARAIPIDYSVQHDDEGVWESRGPAEYKDLGLFSASHGAIGAERIRVASSELPLRWAGRGLAYDLQWVYVGSATMRRVDGEEVELGTRDCMLHSPDCGCILVGASDDCQLLVLRTPLVPGQKLGVILGPIRPIPPAGGLPCRIERDGPEMYVFGAGPRKFFEYRDLRSREVTSARIHTHVIRALKDADIPEGGTGVHSHSMSQYYIVLGGEGNIEMDNGDRCKMRRGDSMTIGERQRHDEFRFSPDYDLLQMCFPADYDTVTESG